MNFKKMDVKEIKKVVDYLFEERTKAVIITLIDGTSICGLLPPRVQRYYDGELRNVEPQDYCYSGNELNLLDTRQCKEKIYRIPFNNIAGICALSYSQKGYRMESLEFPFTREKKTGLCNSITSKTIVNQRLLRIDEESLMNEGRYQTGKGFEDLLLDDLYTKCKQYDFPISVIHALYYRIIPKPIAWGELKVKSNFPIYADWEYVSHVSGGITSIGAGILAVSGSIGWQNSLYGAREQLMGKEIQSLNSICQSEKNSVVISAYVDTVRLKKSNKMTIPYESIEGEKWFPVILSEKKIGISEKFRPKEWCIGYMKESCILVPKIAFESIQEPLTIQGEIMPISLNTSFGECECVIKIRNISAKIR